MLIAQDCCPSVFFRFPGLVANPDALKTVKNLGLIPLGADAWLAKDQIPQNGSIILVHGNGNEPAGITLATPFVRGPKQVALLSLENEAQRHAATLR